MPDVFLLTLFRRGVEMSGLSVFHFIALVVGIVVIFLIRKKYRKISLGELTLIIILYAALVLLFTEPIVGLLKELLT